MGRDENPEIVYFVLVLLDLVWVQPKDVFVEREIEKT